MTIKLPGTTGLELGPDNVDLLQIIDSVANSAKFTRQRTIHFVSSLGAVKTLEDAVQALKDGTLEVNEFGGYTFVILSDDGQGTFYIWNAEEEELHKVGRPVGNKYIEFHSVNYGQFDNNGDVFNFNKSWFISVGCLTMHATSAFQTLFSAGDNTFNWLAGAGNYGIYLDDRLPVTQGGSSRANTWTDPELSRVLLNYNHVTKKLEYWLGPMGSNPTLKILNIEQYQGDPVNLYETPTELCLGKAVSGTGGLKGEINELIGGTVYLEAAQVQAIYSGDGVDWSAYPEITFGATLGEDTWPSIGTYGTVLSNGTMNGGSADDYKDVPE